MTDNFSLVQQQERARAIEDAVNAVLVGQTDVVRQVMVALLAGGHVLLEGVPGLGKTLLVRTLAKAVGLPFGRIQFTPDLMPSDVTGHALYDPGAERFRIRKGPIFTSMLLADEINRAPAKTQAALLEVMQERQVTIEGQAFTLDEPFMVLATENPIDQEGTYPLPEAELDRFLFKVVIDYPGAQFEKKLTRMVLEGTIASNLDVAELKPVADAETVLSLRRQLADTTVDDAVLDYALRLARATRDLAGLERGASPRATIALAHAGRAHALMEGRDFVTPDDIKAVASPVLRHRIQLSPDAEIEGRTADAVLAQLLDQVDAPRQ